MQDCELLPEDLEKLVKSYKAVVQLELGEEFPEDPKAQLWGAVGAVFNSWMNQRAKTYRHLVILRFLRATAGNSGQTPTCRIAFIYIYIATNSFNSGFADDEIAKGC